MEHLTELELMLFALKLEIAADKDKHTIGWAGRLAIHGRDVVLALLEREAGELADNVLRA